MSDKKSKKNRGEADDQRQKGIENDPDVQAAADEVEQARDKLRAAEDCYRKLRDQAAEKIEQLQGSTLGDAFDFVVSTTKRHPVIGLLTAGVMGFYLGRLFRR